jgi:hypothetical protein
MKKGSVICSYLLETTANNILELKKIYFAGVIQISTKPRAVHAAAHLGLQCMRFP